MKKNVFAYCLQIYVPTYHEEKILWHMYEMSFDIFLRILLYLFERSLMQ